MNARFLIVVVSALAVAGAGCKKKESPQQTPVSPGETEKGVQPAAPAPTPAAPEPAAASIDLDQVESKEILERQPVTESAEVLHVLVGWREAAEQVAAQRGSEPDPRAMRRTQEDAARLALTILGKIKNGVDMKALMQEYSEDPGSAESGRTYEATPDAGLVPEFKALCLRLEVGEAGVVMTQFGYHVIKRVR
jgi:hypothetical protein